MIAIWSKRYFRSVWCWNESRAFLRRDHEDLTFSPIIPVVIHGGSTFPDFAQETRWSNLSEFVLSNDGLPSLTKYRKAPFFNKFKGRMNNDVVPSVVSAIEHAPEWSSDWVSERWLTEDPLPLDDDLAPII